VVSEVGLISLAKDEMAIELDIAIATIKQGCDFLKCMSNLQSYVSEI
jgi:Trp operon repressor